MQKLYNNTQIPFIIKKEGGVCVKRIKAEGWLKLSLTFALAIYSLVVAIITHNSGVFAAMCSSSGGDIKIMSSRDALGTGKDKTQFTQGVIFFAVAHLIYVLSMEGTKGWSVIVGLEALLVVIICVVAWGTEMKENILLNVLYAQCLALAAFNAWNFHFRAGLGYVFFIISDIILVIKEDDKPWYQIPIWFFYVLGQALIISSFQ